MARPKEPPPTFEVEFDGPGIVPESIPLVTLSRVLTAVQRLTSGSDAPDDDEEPDTTLAALNGRVGLRLTESMVIPSFTDTHVDVLNPNELRQWFEE